MRINSSSHPPSITQLNRANAGLVNFLQSRAESAVGSLLQRVNSRSVSSGRDALSISSLTTLPVSQRGLLASLAVPADSIGESRTGLAEIRTQLNTILRTAVDSRRKGTTAETLLDQQKIDHAIAEINRLVGDGRSASGRAVLTLQGTADGTLEQAGALRIAGGAGEAVLAVTQGESLTGFAERVNARAAQTGVNAIVNGNRVVFQSAEMGPEAGISVQSVAGGVTITGVNPEQLADFVVNSIDSNASETLSGKVSAAHVAELMYDGGAAPLMFDTGTLAISGDLGSGSLTFSRVDSLTELASLVNGQALSTGVTAKVSGGQLVFQSVQTGSDAQISIALDYNRLEVSGVNPAQVSLFDVQSLLPGSNNTISGDITRRAEQAVQAYVGQSGQVTDTATFDLTGSLGTETVAMQRDELLTDVADRINLLSSSTGVTASVNGDELQLQSVDYGSDAIVSLEVTNLLQIGANNPAQIVDVRVDAFPPQASYLIAGEVREVASTARLKYSGGAGAVVKDNAVFTLAGETGGIEVAVSKSESLLNVADRINSETGATGVRATVSGNDLLLDSVSFGSSAHVYVEVTSGKFDVSGGGGFGDGKIDYGQDITVRIDGVDLVGQGNRLSFSDGPGSYTLDFAAGFSGDFDSISVVSASTASGAGNLTDGSHATASGFNTDQIVRFDVLSTTPSSIQTITGEVRNLAERAQLKYSGDNGSEIKANATFTLTGNLGSAQYTVIKDESLFDVADRINAETGITGVTATVSGNDMLLKSAEFGSTSQVYVEVTVGTFDVSGGGSSGDGEIDFGEDAEIRFNGVDYTGAGNQVSFTDATGSYQVEVVAEFDGDFDPITVASIDNAFQLNGGDGNGHAVGVDAQGVINGQAVTANVNTFLFNDALGSYQLDVQNGYLGLIDSIKVASIKTAYAIDGGDGDGTAKGHDAQLVVNGQTLSGEDNRYWFESNTGSYVLEFAPDFTGSFDVIEVFSQPTGVFAVLGGDGAGTALGSDPLLRQARTVRFSVVDRLSQVGSFAIGLDAASLGGTRGTLQQLATGGGKAGLGAHATDAITISQQALAYISNVESLLDQAAARDAPSILSLQSVSSTRSANLSLLAIRNALQSGDNRVVESIQHDPQRVLQLLTSKTW